MADSKKVRTIKVDASQEPIRIDRYLAEATKDWAPVDRISRSQLQKLLRDGGIKLNSRIVAKASEKVASGDTVELVLEAATALHVVAPTPFALEILFEDQHVIVLNKPAGIWMHPGAGLPTATIAGALVHHIGKSIHNVGGEGRPGIVHRLDKDTTGVIVAAKSPAAHAELSRQFESRTVGRHYAALVYSTPRATRLVRREDQGEISTLIGRDEKNRKKMAVVEAGGRKAITRWTVVERMQYGTLLSVRLKTGRTHQIRVHMEHIKSPVVGDTSYGDFSGLPEKLSNAAKKFGRQALHAQVLAFDHPMTGARMEFSSPLPDDFLELLGVFRSEL